MEPNIHGAVRELRKALSLSQQAFATQLGMSIRAVVNYEKDRSPTARALAQLERLAAETHHPELARTFRQALGSQLGLGMSERLPLSSEELYLDRAFRRCLFENPESTAAVRIRKLLEPYVTQLMTEDEHMSRIIEKRQRAPQLDR
jgi:transcriptional regulator with XRE-family HTH domain